MIPASLTDSLTHLMLEVRVTLPHEFPVISAGLSQLSKYQRDVLERLAILGHSLRSVLDPTVAIAVP